MKYQYVSLSALIVLACLSSVGYTSELTAEKWEKNFEKINEYLEEDGPSDNVELNMNKIKELLENKSSQPGLFGESFMVPTLKLLVTLSKLPEAPHECISSQHTKMAAIKEANLPPKAQLHGPSYPPTRLDTIIEHYAFEESIICQYPVPWPIRLNYDYQQSAYEKINSLLPADVKDAEVLMSKVEELRKATDPSLACALNQLTQLKTTLEENTCDERGYETLYKNDLANKLKVQDSQDKPTLPTEILFQHYAKKHEQLCRPLVPSKLQSQLMKLNQSSYISVLGMVRAYLFKSIRSSLCPRRAAERADDAVMTEQVATPAAEASSSSGGQESKADRLAGFKQRMFEDLNKKWLNEDFSTPMMREHLSAAFEKCPKVDAKVDFGLLNLANSDVLFIYMQSRSIENDEKDMKYEDKFNKYLYVPCENFLRVFGRLVEADEYGSNMNPTHTHSSKNNVVAGEEELSYVTIRAGVRACKNIKSNMHVLKNAPSWLS